MALTIIEARTVYDRINRAHRINRGVRAGEPDRGRPLSRLDWLGKNYRFGQSISDLGMGDPVDTEFFADPDLQGAAEYRQPEGFKWFYPPGGEKPYVRTSDKLDSSGRVITSYVPDRVVMRDSDVGRLGIHELRHKAIQILRDNPGFWKDVTYTNPNTGNEVKLIDSLMPSGRWSEKAEHDIIYAHSSDRGLAKERVGNEEKIERAMAMGKAVNKAAGLIPTDKYEYFEGLLNVSPTPRSRLSHEEFRKLYEEPSGRGR